MELETTNSPPEKRNTSNDKNEKTLLLIAVMEIVFAGCGGDQKQSFQSKEDFENAKIGITVGSP